MNTTTGDLTEMSDDPKRAPIWTVRWKTARMDYSEGQRPGADMQGVTGTIYRDGQAASTFEANEGHASKGSGVLVLRVHVVVHSKDPVATMTCDELIWDPTKGFLRAKGAVRLENPGYTLGEFQELLATPDLRSISTPDTFQSK